MTEPAKTDPTRGDGRHVEHAGGRLYVETEGDGPQVLLLHGGLGHMGTVAGLRAFLAAEHRVIAMDSRGMGRSSLGTAAISYRQQEEDALRVLDALGVGRCAVVGISDGGITGLRLAARGDGRIGALATVGSRWRAEHSRHLWDAFPAIDRRSMGAGPYAPLLADYDRLSPDQDFDRLGREYSRMWRQEGADGHPGDRVADITVPVLIAAGDRDPIVPLEPVLELYGLLPAGQLLVLPGAGHEAHADRADLYHPALAAFLAAASVAD